MNAPRHVRARRRPSRLAAALRAPLIAALALGRVARDASEFTADVIEGWALEADVWAGGRRASDPMIETSGQAEVAA